MNRFVEEYVLGGSGRRSRVNPQTSVRDGGSYLMFWPDARGLEVLGKRSTFRLRKVANDRLVVSARKTSSGGVQLNDGGDKNAPHFAIRLSTALGKKIVCSNNHQQVVTVTYRDDADSEIELPVDYKLEDLR
jgi:hypothetical protein